MKSPDKNFYANPRSTAAWALAQVFGRGQTLDAALAQRLPALTDPSARALAQELCYGVLRWHPRLEALTRQLLHKPLKDEELHCLLLIGLYQLIYLAIAPYAAVDQTVAASEALGKPWTKKLINAVLRSYQRDSIRLLGELDRSETSLYAHPTWLIDRVRSIYPHRWQGILEANNQRPPMWLRVNALRLARSAYLERLREEGMEASETPQISHALLLKKPVAVESLPGFAEGLVSVQDAAAQLAAPLLDVRPGQRVLDACAAPGGKTCHILESQPNLRELIALDCDESRLRRITQNLERLRLRGRCTVGDATLPETWWDRQKFDRILLDAPCSATGVIRRHPDIKLLRIPADVGGFCALQEQLLTALWPLLTSGGMLLYATCSILPEENEQQVQKFLNRHPDARLDNMPYSRGGADTPGHQMLPGDDAMDGFYYARLRKS